MDYKHLISFFLQKLKKDNIGAYAAQAALFIIMSAIPFLLVFLSLLRFTPVSESTVLSVIQMILPGSDQDHADADQCGKKCIQIRPKCFQSQ